jgi:hypothetical protein
MSLSSMYQELHRRAAETGEDRALDLRGGARIAVRVKDGVVTLTISRSKKKVGDTELITFKRDCGVPDDAARYPAEGQGVKEHSGMPWHYIVYRWAE